jgi:hypothetical protein
MSRIWMSVAGLLRSLMHSRFWSCFRLALTLEVVDEYENVGFCVGSADADVVHFAGDAEGDVAGLVDSVVTNSAGET